MLSLSRLWLGLATRLNLALASDSFATIAVLIAAYSLVQLLSGPDYLLSLAWALIHLRQHHVSAADQYVFAQFGSSIIAIAGTGAIAYILARYSEPPRKKDVPADDGGAKPSTS